MTLSNRQIERYSRQIIVAGIGGRGQERLLAARLFLMGELDDIGPVLPYMVGAGVGKIMIRTPDGAADARQIIAGLAGLNEDPKVSLAGERAVAADLATIFVGSAATLEIAQASIDQAPAPPVLLARLDAPARIAILPSPPPCPRCADADLVGRFTGRDENAPFVAMVAAAEALKFLAGYEPAAPPAIIRFDGYESKSAGIKQRTEPGGCRCGGDGVRDGG